MLLSNKRKRTAIYSNYNGNTQQNYQPINENNLSHHLYTFKSNHQSKISQHKPLSVQNNHEKYKLIKLVGDKGKNIQEILQGLSCQCGCKDQFKNILDLMMTKIYRLRDERNHLKAELQKKDTLNKRNQTIGINTSFKEIQQSKRNNQLRRLIEDKSIHNQVENSNFISIQGQGHFLNDFLRSQETIYRITLGNIENQTYQSNLLQQSSIERPEYIEDTLILDHSKQSVLKEQNPNISFSKLLNLKSFFEKNDLNMKRLQNYIQKVNTSKEIEVYGKDRLKKNYL